MGGRRSKSKAKKKSSHSAASRVSKTSRLAHCSCDNCNQDAPKAKPKKQKDEEVHSIDCACDECHTTRNIVSYLLANTLNNNKPSECMEPYCIRCLLVNQEVVAAKRRLTRLFKDEALLSANTPTLQEGQVQLTSQLRVIVQNPSISHYIGFKEHKDFLRWLFETGLLTAYERMLRENLRKRDGPVHESFHTVPFYILMTFCWILLPKDEQDAVEDPSLLTFMAVFQERQNRKRYAECLVRSGELTKLCVRYLREPRSTVDLVSVLLLLEKLLSLSIPACKEVISVGGLDFFVELATPGKFQKRVAKERDNGFSYYAREVVCFQEDKLSEYNKCAERRHKIEAVPELDVYKSIMTKDGFIMSGSLACLSSIAKAHPDNRTRVFHTSGSVNTALRYLKHPAFEENKDGDSAFEAACLVESMIEDKELAAYMVEEKQLMSLLDRVIFCTTAEPQGRYLEVLQILLGHKGIQCHQIYDNRHIMLALGCYIHSSLRTLQNTALEILVQLVQERPSVLHLLNSLGVVNEIMFMPYKMHDMWDDPVPEMMETLTKIARKTLKSKWKYPCISAFIPCTQGEFDINKMRKRGNDCFKEGCYEEAIRCYTSALLLGRLDLDVCAILLSNRAECHLRKSRYQEVVRDTTIALSQGFTTLSVYAKTLYRRAKAFDALKRPFEALGDISACLWKKPKEKGFLELHEKVLSDYKKLDGAIYKLRTCENCGLRSEGLRKCANCSTHFCSKTCQKDAWTKHRETCTGGQQQSE